MSNYGKIIRDNLSEVFRRPQADVAEWLGADQSNKAYRFKAFGRSALLTRERILLDGHPEQGPVGVLISLYALHANSEQIRLEPFVAFKDLPNTMPYQGAFSANAERVLVPHVERIVQKRNQILERFDGHDAPQQLTGDESFVLYPLPKIALAYIFYLADDEFPASATCLFCSNALSFMPPDALADVAEYTSKAIIELVTT